MSPSRRGDDRIVLGASPRADLLPPELKAEARLAAQRRALGGVVVLAVLLVAGVYAYATLNAITAEHRLADSGATTTSLLAQKAEYSEITRLQALVDKSEAAQIVGVSTEIEWMSYLQLVQGSLPAGTVVDSYAASTIAPGVEPAAPSEPLLSPSLAKISFVASTPTLPDVSLWIESLSKLPGFADAQARSITIKDDGTYAVTMEMHINDEALAHRFVEPEPEDDVSTTEETDQ